MNINRRHFLISGASLLGACLLPPTLVRRLQRFSGEPAAAIDVPTSARRTLYATEHDDHCWQLALGRPTTEFPPAPSWRAWLSDHENVDPEDVRALSKWIDRGGHDLDVSELGWLDDPVADYLWEGYLESSYLVNDSPEAHALRYLARLKLAHGPLAIDAGEELGRVIYYYGTMPGADSHFVMVEGEAILPALQHRLRELGEDTAIQIST